MRVPLPILVAACALAVGGAAFYVDIHNEEVQPAALVLLVGAGAIGAAWPRWSWLGGLVSGLCILAGHLALRASGATPPFPIQPNVFGALVAVIPAMLGAGVGAGIRWMSSAAAAGAR